MFSPIFGNTHVFIDSKANFGRPWKIPYRPTRHARHHFRNLTPQQRRILPRWVCWWFPEAAWKNDTLTIQLHMVRERIISCTSCTTFPSCTTTYCTYQKCFMSCVVLRNAFHPTTTARHILSSADSHPIPLESQAKCKDPWESEYCTPIICVYIFLQHTYIIYIPIYQYVLLTSPNYIWQMGATKGIIFRGQLGAARLPLEDFSHWSQEFKKHLSYRGTKKTEWIIPSCLPQEQTGYPHWNKHSTWKHGIPKGR